MSQLTADLLLIGLSGTLGAAATWLAIHRHALLGARRYWRQHRPPPVEVVVADPQARRRTERAIIAAIAQLGGAHGGVSPASALIAQRIIWDGWSGEGGRQIHACARRPARFAADPRPRFFLALEVDGRALPLDEILAALTELWSLHLKGDDRDFVPILLGPAAPQRRPQNEASPHRRPSPLAADD